jgi:YhcH/YjgK/YiaL family protein
MILDQLTHASLYSVINDRLALAFEYLTQNDFMQIDPGRYELDGDSVYAMVQQYDTKPSDQGKWEAHRQYFDVQYVARGIERMGYAPLESLQAGPYHEDGDYLFLEGEGIYVPMPAGTFVVLAPQDGHIPGIAMVEGPTPVRKVVVKVKI